MIFLVNQNTKSFGCIHFAPFFQCPARVDQRNRGTGQRYKRQKHQPVESDTSGADPTLNQSDRTWSANRKSVRRKRCNYSLDSGNHIDHSCSNRDNFCFVISDSKNFIQYNNHNCNNQNHHKVHHRNCHNNFSSNKNHYNIQHHYNNYN